MSSQVSAQVRKELQALFFGSGQAGEEQGELPEALVLWLSQRYVSGADLQASLAALELSILRNVSLQLEMSREQTLAQAQAHADTITQTVSQSVQHTATAEGLSEEVRGHAFLLSADYCEVLHVYSNRKQSYKSRINLRVPNVTSLSPLASASDCPERFETVLAGSDRPGGLCP